MATVLAAAAGQVTFTGTAAATLIGPSARGALTLTATADPPLLLAQAQASGGLLLRGRWALTAGLQAVVRRVYPVPLPTRARMRIAAQRILTGQWLHHALPLADLEVSWEVSGPGGITGHIDPEAPGLPVPGDGLALLEPWATALYAVDEGVVRAGAIVAAVRYEGQRATVEAAGFSGYPHGIPYTGDFTITHADPLDVVRHIWGHVQSFPDSDLGVVVDDTDTGVLIGDERDSDGKVQPYTLQWWQNPDCGQEIDDLADQTPFDYREHHRFTPDGGVEHLLQLGYPRIGRRRGDLTFTLGENVVAVPDVDRDGADFAQTGLGLGAGEGRAMLRVTVPARDGRLRRVRTVTDKSVTGRTRLAALVRRDLATFRRMVTVPRVTIDARHRNAPLGSWQPGDTVPVRVDVPHLGRVTVDHRIVRAAYRPARERAELTLEPI